MAVEHFEVLVEEPSSEAALRILLPRMIGPDITFDIRVFQGKPNLLQSLPQRLRGYTSWLQPTYCVVVLVDQDDDDCRKLKAQLEFAAVQAGLHTRSSRKGTGFQVINRIAVEELEAWFFGDWQSVCAAFPRVSRTVPQQSDYRNPDAIKGGTWQALERILQRAGYFSTGLRKIEAARAIAQHMQPERNTSRSFQVFRQAIFELTTL